MLTKQEREEISKRVISFNEDYLCYADIYECLFGERPRYSALSEEYDKAIRDRLIDLCDTSNMLELPVDKDGEVIHIGDVLFNESSGKSYRAGGYDYDTDGCAVVVFGSNSRDRLYLKPDEFTHKKPVTIASLVGEIRHALRQNAIMNKDTTAKLWEIADQLEKLGDSDD